MVGSLPNIAFTPRLAGFQPVTAFKGTDALAIDAAFAEYPTAAGMSTFHLVHMEPRSGGETSIGLARCLWKPGVAADVESLDRVAMLGIAPLERLRGETDRCFAFDAINGVAFFRVTTPQPGRDQADGRIADAVAVSGLADSLRGNTFLHHTALMDIPNRVAIAAGVDVLFATGDPFE